MSRRFEHRLLCGCGPGDTAGMDTGPIEPFQERRQLRGRQPHHAIFHLWPAELDGQFEKLKANNILGTNKTHNDFVQFGGLSLLLWWKYLGVSFGRQRREQATLNANTQGLGFSQQSVFVNFHHRVKLFFFNAGEFTFAIFFQ